MSEKNNNIFENDLLMRTILESGQEEVPGRVWDAVSERLEKADAAKVRKPATLWWSRAGIAAAAVAAAVAAVVSVNREEEQVEMLPRSAQGNIIAVVQPEVASQTGEAELLAYINETSVTKVELASDTISEEKTTINDESQTSHQEIQTANQEETVANQEETVANIEVQIIKDDAPVINAEKTEAAAENTWQASEDWEEKVQSRKMKTSITVSSLTEAAQQQQNNTGSGLLKAPSLVLSPTRTGIKERETQTKYGIPVSVGAGVRFEFTPRWSLGVGLNYTLLTRTLQGTYTHVTETGSIDNLITSDIKNSQHYIGMPVNAFFNIINSKAVHFYTYAGGTVEKCVSDRYHVLTNNIFHKEKVDGVQLSAAVGLGAEFTITHHLGLYIDPNIRYYFDCDQSKSIRTAQPLMFGVEAGLRFKI